MKFIYRSLPLAAIFVVSVLVFNPTTVKAAEPGYYSKIVDYNFVKDFAVIPIRKDVAIIDSRPMKRRYNNGHIPGAISIPNSQFKKMTNVLPKDKSKLLVFYCGGVKCMLSHKSAYKAEKLGHTNIRVYSAGYPDWIAQGQLGSVSAAYVKKQLAGEKATVIDARPVKRKYAKGHVPGALSIPNSRFAKLTNMLPASKKSPLIFYCDGMKCPLSVKSARKAKALGYTKVKVFQGGYPEWKKAYGAGVMGTKPYAMAKAGGVKAGAEGDTITISSFQDIMKNKPDSIYLYDVRDPEEFTKAHMPGAVNLSVEDLEDKVSTLPSDKPIVFVCATGARSGEAYDIVKLEREKLKVYFLDATVTYDGKTSYKVAKN